MDTKPIKPKRTSVYSAEELEPRDWAADEAWADAWIERNREQIERDLAEAREQIKRGECKTYSAPGELAADIMARVRKRLAREKRTAKKKTK